MKTSGEMDKAQIDMKQIMNRIGFDCEVMQYIGEKDKNGKEIYEGDIFIGRYGKDIVRFVDAGFYPFSESVNAPSPNESEVIGNIYENPELNFPHLIKK